MEKKDEKNLNFKDISEVQRLLKFFKMKKSSSKSSWKFSNFLKTDHKQQRTALHSGLTED